MEKISNFIDVGRNSRMDQKAASTKGKAEAKPGKGDKSSAAGKKPGVPADKKVNVLSLCCFYLKYLIIFM